MANQEKNIRESARTRSSVHSRTESGRTLSSVHSHPVPQEHIEAAVKSVKYGVVQVIIQDGRVVQIDKTEKLRLV